LDQVSVSDTGPLCLLILVEETGVVVTRVNHLRQVTGNFLMLKWGTRCDHLFVCNGGADLIGCVYNTCT